MKGLVMRLVLQRVVSASVAVEGAEVSRIGRGVVVLVGIGEDDTPADVEWAAERIGKTKLWPEKIGEAAEGKSWWHSACSAQLEVLCVSQFTLLGTLKKKGAVSFHRAMKPEGAKGLYEQLLESLRSSLGLVVRDGVFGAKMVVSLANDGPVSLSLDSRLGNGLAAVAGAEETIEGGEEKVVS